MTLERWAAFELSATQAALGALWGYFIARLAPYWGWSFGVELAAVVVGAGVLSSLVAVAEFRRGGR
jgi:branched-subunit amino acid ABC-type transport system permease component